MRNYPKHTIHPGEYYVSKSNIFLNTLLGSCVAVCLWDPIKKVCGMNHFLLAYRKSSSAEPLLASEAGRYGIHAMEVLINEMLRLGAVKRNIKAKAFGGANVLPLVSSIGGEYAIGELNSKFIRLYLIEEGIPLVAVRLGGKKGRVIYFHTQDFSVYVKTINEQQTRTLSENEQRYLGLHLTEIEQDKANQGKVFYW